MELWKKDMLEIWENLDVALPDLLSLLLMVLQNPSKGFHFPFYFTIQTNSKKTTKRGHSGNSRKSASEITLQLGDTVFTGGCNTRIGRNYTKRVCISAHRLLHTLLENVSVLLKSDHHKVRHFKASSRLVPKF